MSVFQLLYVSGAARAITDQDIDQILGASRKNNAALGVTGMLLVGNGTFIQVLEGERSTVRALAARIKFDPRHRNFMVLVELDAPKRAFGQWQMGFRKLDPARAQDAGVFEISRKALEARISDEEGGMMLSTITAFGRDFLPQ